MNKLSSGESEWQTWRINVKLKVMRERRATPKSWGSQKKFLSLGQRERTTRKVHGILKLPRVRWYTKYERIDETISEQTRRQARMV